MNTYTIYCRNTLNPCGYLKKVVFHGTSADAREAALDIQREGQYAGVSVMDCNHRIIFEVWGRW